MPATLPSQRQPSSALTPYFESHARLQRFPRGQNLFSPLDQCPGLFLVTRGELHVSRPLPSGESLLMRRMTPGQIFGEVILFSEEGFSGWISAAAETETLFLSRSGVEGLLTQDKNFRRLFFQEIRRRVGHLNERVEILSRKTVEERLYLFLVHHGGYCRCTRQEAADQMGCSREALSRCLSQMADRGEIETGRGWMRALFSIKTD